MGLSLFIAAALGACRSPHTLSTHTQRSGASSAREPIRLAVTVDDLPGAGMELTGWPKARILHELIKVLGEYAVPQPVGFFTGGNIDADPDTPSALRDWVAAGFRLENHTYSHVSANTLGAAAFVADIERNEQILSTFVPGAEVAPRYFRYPFLERGSDVDRPIIRAYLREHGYRVADVSVDFEDWAYTDAFVRCAQRGNDEAVRALRNDYIENAMAELYWSAETARQVLGRSLPQVLLVHANPFTAQELGAVLSAYRGAGVEFISLEEALLDPVYTEVDTVEHRDVTLIEALITARGAHLYSFMPPPDTLLGLACQ